MTPFIEALRESISSINKSTRISMIIVSCCWIFIFTFYSITTIYQDHINLVKENQELRRKNPSAPNPNLTTIRLAGIKHYTSSVAQYPFGLEVVMQTDKTIESVSYVIEFSGDIGGGEALVEPYEDFSNKLTGIIKGRPNMFAFRWTSPAFTPDKPIKIRVYSQKYIDVINWKTWTKTNK